MRFNYGFKFANFNKITFTTRRPKYIFVKGFHTVSPIQLTFLVPNLIFILKSFEITQRNKMNYIENGIYLKSQNRIISEKKKRHTV